MTEKETCHEEVRSIYPRTFRANMRGVEQILHEVQDDKRFIFCPCNDVCFRYKGYKKALKINKLKSRH